MWFVITTVAPRPASVTAASLPMPELAPVMTMTWSVRSGGVRRAMPVAPFDQTATDGVTLAVGSAQAADVTLLRPDQSPVPVAELFGKIRPSGPPPGVILPGRAGPVSFTARLGPAALRLGDAAVTVSIEDADSEVYQVGAGSLPADGRDHTLTASLGPAGGAIYPLRLASISRRSAIASATVQR